MFYSASTPLNWPLSAGRQLGHKHGIHVLRRTRSMKISVHGDVTTMDTWRLRVQSALSRWGHDGIHAESHEDIAWDTSSVTTMEQMSADAFNQPLSRWDVSSVTNNDAAFYRNVGHKHEEMFYDADAFNKDILGWDTFKVTDLILCFILQTHGMRGSRRLAVTATPFPIAGGRAGTTRATRPSASSMATWATAPTPSRAARPASPSATPATC